MYFLGKISLSKFSRTQVKLSETKSRSGGESRWLSLIFELDPTSSAFCSRRKSQGLKFCASNVCNSIADVFTNTAFFKCHRKYFQLIKIGVDNRIYQILHSKVEFVLFDQTIFLKFVLFIVTRKRWLRIVDIEQMQINLLN